MFLRLCFNICTARQPRKLSALFKNRFVSWFFSQMFEICCTKISVCAPLVVVVVVVAVRQRRESFDTFIYHWKATEEFVKYTHTHTDRS